MSSCSARTLPLPAAVLPLLLLALQGQSAAALLQTESLGGVMGLPPPLGWSTWLSSRFSDSLPRTCTDVSAHFPLKVAGRPPSQPRPCHRASSLPGSFACASSSDSPGPRP